ncbi:MAG TPA: FAD:protein FMN transferase [Micromonosporaceae bacterium]|nr:FAD:protein FMN transferase [Micromonosporaceae bacterium]
MTGYRRSVTVMGTVATVELYDAPDAERLADEVFAWLREVDRRFSTYRAGSDVNRLHRGELTLAECAPEVSEVLARCAEFWRDTDGYFDVYATGRLDPSGYVKGWSVQVASERLFAAGAVNHLVDAGGDIQTRGRPAPDARWEIGIRHPWHPASVCAVVTGTDLAVATSGTYERGCHVVDPRTGRPRGDLRSVTVVGRDLGTADVYATAAVAMGPPALRWLAGLDGYESMVVTEEGVSYRSAGLPVA